MSSLGCDLVRSLWHYMAEFEAVSQPNTAVSYGCYLVTLREMSMDIKYASGLSDNMAPKLLGF